jgi:hypothetical protein
VNVLPTELNVISSREDYIQHLMPLLRVDFNPKAIEPIRSRVLSGPLKHGQVRSRAQQANIGCPLLSMSAPHGTGRQRLSRGRAAKREGTGTSCHAERGR